MIRDTVRRPQGPRTLHPTPEQARALEAMLRPRNKLNISLYGIPKAFTWQNPTWGDGKVNVPGVGPVSYSSSLDLADPSGCDLATISKDLDRRWMVTFHISRAKLAERGLVYCGPEVPTAQNGATPGREWISGDWFLLRSRETEEYELLALRHRAKQQELDFPTHLTKGLG